MPSATRLPPLNALRCFKAAARHQHFGRAGDELHLTHGAISRAVSLLEADLGLPLFERRQRRVHLADAGRALAQSVTEALQDMRRTTERLRAQARQPRGWTLSCEPTLLMRWVLRRWPGFQALHPALHFRLLAGGGAQSLDDAGIDLAVRRDDFDWPARFTAEPLFAERIGPVCRPAQADAWFRGGVLQAQAPRLHTRTRPGAWDDWARCTGQALPPTPAEAPAQVFDHFYFSLQAAVAGLGVAMGPRHLVQDDLASGLLVAPLGFVPDGSRYWLLTATDAQHAPSGVLRDWLRAQGEGASAPPADARTMRA